MRTYASLGIVSSAILGIFAFNWYAPSFAADPPLPPVTPAPAVAKPVEEKKLTFKEIYENADYSTNLKVLYEYEVTTYETEIHIDKEGKKTERRVPKISKEYVIGQLSGFVWKHEKTQKFYVGTAGHIFREGYKIVLINADFKNGVPNETMELFGYSPPDESDSALLRFKKPNYVFKGNTAKLGNSDLLKPLDAIMAIGNQLTFLHHIPTTGTIATTDTPVPHRIVHTAIVNPGGSGGPLLNESGEVVGMNVNVLLTPETFTTLSGAVPINDFKKLADKLAESDKPKPEAPKTEPKTEKPAETPKK